MADMYDRIVCGNCGFTEFKKVKGKKPTKEKRAKEQKPGKRKKK